MPDDPAIAVIAYRRAPMDRAFETVERSALSRHNDLESFIVVVSTHFTLRHISSFVSIKVMNGFLTRKIFQDFCLPVP
jgi:hypothetical protein